MHNWVVCAYYAHNANYAKITQKLRKIKQKLRKNYAEITQKYAKIMHKLRTNYAEITQKLRKN